MTSSIDSSSAEHAQNQVHVNPDHGFEELVSAVPQVDHSNAAAARLTSSSNTRTSSWGNYLSNTSVARFFRRTEVAPQLQEVDVEAAIAHDNPVNSNPINFDISQSKEMANKIISAFNFIEKYLGKLPESLKKLILIIAPAVPAIAQLAMQEGSGPILSSLFVPANIPLGLATIGLVGWAVTLNSSTKLVKDADYSKNNPTSKKSVFAVRANNSPDLIRQFNITTQDYLIYRGRAAELEQFNYQLLSQNKAMASDLSKAQQQLAVFNASTVQSPVRHSKSFGPDESPVASTEISDRADTAREASTPSTTARV